MKEIGCCHTLVMLFGFVSNLFSLAKIGTIKYCLGGNPHGQEKGGSILFIDIKRKKNLIYNLNFQWKLINSYFLLWWQYLIRKISSQIARWKQDLDKTYLCVLFGYLASLLTACSFLEIPPKTLPCHFKEYREGVNICILLVITVNSQGDYMEVLLWSIMVREPKWESFRIY